MSPNPPTSIGRYEIIREIARSNDIVYEAWDNDLQRRVALKLMNVPSVDQRQDRITRFQREARATALLIHPNIASVFDFGIHGNDYYIVMEYVSGPTLRQVLDSKGAFSEVEVKEICREILFGLEAAHTAGVIHRDIKPDNIFLLGNGGVKLADFGIARIQHEESITLTGQAFGTPSYMSPEQVRGQDVGPSSDFFSLGILAYEMSTGFKPFVGPSPFDICQKIVNESPDFSKIKNSSLKNLIEKCLDKDPLHRPQSAQEMLALLYAKQGSAVQSSISSSVQPIKPRVSRKRYLVAAGIVIVFTTAIALVTRVRHEDQVPKSVSNPSAPKNADAQKPKTIDEFLELLQSDRTLNEVISSTEVDGSKSSDKVNQVYDYLHKNYAIDFNALSEDSRNQLINKILGYKVMQQAPPDSRLPTNTDANLEAERQFSVDDSTHGSNLPPITPKSSDEEQVTKPAIKPTQETQREFSLGSTEDDVLSVQGTPTSISERSRGKVFHYDISDVEFESGVVTNYSNISHNLKFRILPKVRSDKDWFTLGSTEDEVLSVQGTPTSISVRSRGKVFHYDISDVEFVNGVVTNYSNISHNLKIRISSH